MEPLEKSKEKEIDLKLLDLQLRRLENAISDFRENQRDSLEKAIAAARNNAVDAQLAAKVCVIEDGAKRTLERAERDHELAVEEIELMKQRLC